MHKIPGNEPISLIRFPQLEDRSSSGYVRDPMDNTSFLNESEKAALLKIHVLGSQMIAKQIVNFQCTNFLGYANV